MTLIAGLILVSMTRVLMKTSLANYAILEIPMSLYTDTQNMPLTNVRECSRGPWRRQVRRRRGESRCFQDDTL